MSEGVDRYGVKILPGARVYRRPQPHPIGVGELPGVTGYVDEVVMHEQSGRWIARIREVGTFAYRVIFCDECRVQKSETRASSEHKIIDEALKAKKKTKREKRT